MQTMTSRRFAWSGAKTSVRLFLLGFLILGLLANTFVSGIPAAAAAQSGGVLAWGSNRGDQLGLTYRGSDRANPAGVNATTDSGMVALAAAGEYTLALRADGTVISWGDNFPAAQLGQGSKADQLDPGAVQGVGGVTAIAAGGEHGLAISGGNVYSWGSNYYGQLGAAGADTCNVGNCNTSARIIPGLSGVKAVGAGVNHSLAVTNDGSVYAWGLNLGGAIGDANVSKRTTPTKVAGIDGAVAVAGGYDYSAALKGDGTVWMWGSNSRGQFGNGAFQTGSYPTPAQVPGLSGVVAIASGHSYMLALKGDGTVYAWGRNDDGQVGNGSIATNANCYCTVSPSAVVGLAGVTAIAAGSEFGLAVVNDGTVRAWGSNGYSQLGVPSPDNITTAAVVPSISYAQAVAAGSGHSVALNAVPQYGLAVGTDGNGSGTVAPGSGNYNAGAQVQVTAQAAAGSRFIGWTVDGQVAGLNNPLTVTMNASHTVVATFGKVPDFTDVTPDNPYFNAIQELAARGIIRGYTAEDGKLYFGSTERTKRAQMAALIARPLGWDLEDHGNGFSDQGSVDGNLWRNVGALAFYNVARGYKAETCGALGVPAPCYGPTDEVVYAQVVSFITRGMVAKGYWQQQPENPALYPNVPADSGHRQDIATYVHYAGALPDTSNVNGAWSGWDQPAPRGWFAEAEWRALNSYFKLR